MIGGFSASPSSVAAGTATTLTASSVTDSGSTITGVDFYRESNGTLGLQIGSDTLVGADAKRHELEQQRLDQRLGRRHLYLLCGGHRRPRRFLGREFDDGDGHGVCRHAVQRHQFCEYHGRRHDQQRDGLR